MFEIDLGDKVKDSITKFRGTVVARCEYLNGCISYQVEGKEPEKEIWFDEERLVITKRIHPVRTTHTGGGVHSKPPSLRPHAI